MTFDIFNFIRANGVNDFDKWWSKLQKKERTKLAHKIDMLELYGDALHPHMLSDSPVPGIQKIRVQGNPKLRPLVCKGPQNIQTEYTILLGAKEVGSAWNPVDAPETANGNKQSLTADKTRRVRHEKDR